MLLCGLMQINFRYCHVAHVLPAHISESVFSSTFRVFLNCLLPLQGTSTFPSAPTEPRTANSKNLCCISSEPVKAFQQYWQKKSISGGGEERFGSAHLARSSSSGRGRRKQLKEVVTRSRRQQLRVDIVGSTSGKQPPAHPLCLPADPAHGELLPSAPPPAERHRRCALVVPVGHQGHAWSSFAYPGLDSLAPFPRLLVVAWPSSAIFSPLLAPSLIINHIIFFVLNCKHVVLKHHQIYLFPEDKQRHKCRTKVTYLHVQEKAYII